MSFPNWHKLTCLIRVSERWPGRYSSAPRRMAKARRSSEVQIFRRLCHDPTLIQRWSGKEATCVTTVDVCTTGKCFFTITSRTSMAFPRQSRREHLWVRQMEHCWRAITTMYVRGQHWRQLKMWLTFVRLKKKLCIGGL